MKNKIQKILGNSTYLVILVAFMSGMVHYVSNTGEYHLSRVEPQQGWIQLAALAIGAGISIWQGAKQKKAARELEKMNTRPEMRVSRGTLTNLALTQRAAEEGLPTAVSSSYLNNLRLGTATSLRNNLLYGGRNTNANSTMRTYNEGLESLASAEAEAVVRNRKDLLNANEQLAREEQNLFETQYRDYRETATNVANLRSAGNENIASGVGAGLSFVAGGGLNKTAATPATTTPKAAKTPDYATSTISAGLSRDWQKLVNKSSKLA